MGYLLNLVYLLLLIVFSPWLVYSAIRKGKYREGLAAKFLGRVPARSGNGKCIWLHAVSVGEVNVLGPLLMCLEERHPDWDCVISTTTKTGYALARNKYAPRTVFYCPLDFTWAARRAMRRLRPDLLVLTELELWPNLVRAARKHGARVAVINGRLSEKSARGYGRIRWVFAAVLRELDVIAVQNPEYGERFRQLGAPAEAIHVTGSIKFDGAQTDRDNPRTRQLAELAGFTSESVVLLAGSTQEPEESMALTAFEALSTEFPRLHLIITPRHPERFEEVARVIQQSGVRWRRRSDLGQIQGHSQARVLLVDAIGELGAWWGTAHIAYVGGSMGKRGGQNMIEPAAYGAAVSFGPYTHNFRDVVAMLLEHDAAVVVHDGHELTEFVRKCQRDPGYAEGLGSRAQQLVKQQVGAADRTCDLLTSLLSESSMVRRRSVA